jgi:ABC-type uncharacterized transport system fused permease/ATPase subunit
VILVCVPLRIKGTAVQSFVRYIEACRRENMFRRTLHVAESIVAKYTPSAVGWTLLATHFFARQDQAGSRAYSDGMYSEYTTRAKLLLGLSSALGNLALCLRGLTRASAYAERVLGLYDALTIQERQHCINSENDSRSDSAVNLDVIQFQDVSLV